MKTNQPPVSTYDQLFALVTPHLTAYRDDLEKHDKLSIETNPGVPFLHWTRSSGTDLMFLCPADSPRFPAPNIEVPYLFGTATREKLVDNLVGSTYYWRDHASSISLCLYFDGSTFRRITPDQATEIARTYARKIKAEWRDMNRWQAHCDRPENTGLTFDGEPSYS